MIRSIIISACTLFLVLGFVLLLGKFADNVYKSLTEPVSVDIQVLPQSYLDDTCMVSFKVFVNGDRGLSLEVWDTETVKCSEAEEVKQAKLIEYAPKIEALKKKMGVE